MGIRRGQGREWSGYLVSPISQAAGYRLEPKKDVIKRLGWSPDEADAAVMALIGMPVVDGTVKQHRGSIDGKRLDWQRITPVRRAVVMAKDAVEAAPNVYTVLFENERVRLLEARVRPGDSSPMHSHPNYLVYGLGDSTVTFTTSAGDSADVEMKAGQAMWREAEEHSAKNLGSTDVVALLFELK